MKHLLVAAMLSITALGACTTASAPEMATYQNQKITLRAETDSANYTFRLFIDNDKVIDQSVQVFGGSSQTFNGVWRGKTVTARATRVSQFASSYVLVDVFINGEHVDTLTV